MSEDGDVDVESAEDVPDIGVEATALTSNGEIYRGGSHDKRAHHNALERRRRDHIKDSFHGLRDCIPSLVGEKVSRAHILNKATEYIRHMQKGGSNREDDICDLARKNEVLEEQVRALDDARACGSAFSAEDLLQNVASRIKTRQAQEIVIQQIQAKAKPTRQQAKATPSKPATTPPSAVAASPAAGAVSDKPKSAPAPKSTETTPTSGGSSLNLLANNIKSTQSLLSALQKNFNNPNSNLPPNIKSLAARVLASPLVRAAQKTTQASSLPRGIVTATTVAKGSNLSSPSSATPLPSKSPSSASASTGTNVQHAESAQSELGLMLEIAPVGRKSASSDAEMQIQAPPSSNVSLPPAEGTPSLLTSQLLEAHNLLQLQGAPSLNTAETAGAPPDIPPHGITTAQGLNISPELLAQVSSLLNIPTTAPVASSAPPLASSDCALLNPQDSASSLQPSLQAPVSSHKRPPPTSSSDPLPPAKKPHTEQ